MSFLNRLKSAFTSPGGNRNHWVHVRCARCGEVITARIDLMNDLSVDYDTGGYWTRKVLIGQGAARCFQPIEITLTFDEKKRLIDRTISGGEFLEPDQVAEAQAAFEEALKRVEEERKARLARLAADQEDTPRS